MVACTVGAEKSGEPLQRKVSGKARTTWPRVRSRPPSPALRSPPVAQGTRAARVPLTSMSLKEFGVNTTPINLGNPHFISTFRFGRDHSALFFFNSVIKKALNRKHRHHCAHYRISSPDKRVNPADHYLQRFRLRHFVSRATLKAINQLVKKNRIHLKSRELEPEIMQSLRSRDSRKGINVEPNITAADSHGHIRSRTRRERPTQPTGPDFAGEKLYVELKQNDRRFANCVGVLVCLFFQRLTVGQNHAEVGHSECSDTYYCRENCSYAGDRIPCNQTSAAKRVAPKNRISPSHSNYPHVGRPHSAMRQGYSEPLHG